MHGCVARKFLVSLIASNFAAGLIDALLLLFLAQHIRTSGLGSTSPDPPNDFSFFQCCMKAPESSRVWSSLRCHSKIVHHLFLKWWNRQPGLGGAPHANAGSKSPFLSLSAPLRGSREGDQLGLTWTTIQDNCADSLFNFTLATTRKKFDQKRSHTNSHTESVSAK